MIVAGLGGHLPTVHRIDTLPTMQLGPDGILVAAKVGVVDDATGPAPGR